MNRMNISKTLLFIVVFAGTLDCFAMFVMPPWRQKMNPRAGWQQETSQNVTLEVPLAEQAGTVRIPQEITSFAIGSGGGAMEGIWVTTGEGKILRFLQGNWRDVSAIFPKTTGGQKTPDDDVPNPPKFKLVILVPYSGIHAITYDGKVYRWSVGQ